MGPECCNPELGDHREKQPALNRTIHKQQCVVPQMRLPNNHREGPRQQFRKLFLDRLRVRFPMALDKALWLRRVRSESASVG